MPELLRAAIYARYSTDLQNEKSTEDQIDLCRAYAARERYEVVATYADKARSGASLIGRDEVMRMLADANERKFDVIIVEALDRLSRDMEDLAGIHKRLSFLGIRLVAVHEGQANTLMVGLRGLVGQLMREDNVHKIRRGMTGLVKSGLSAGGKAYGYRPDPMNKGKLMIVEEEADVVRHIFRSYAKGVSPQAICHGLNARHIAPPRGKHWQPSALLGMEARGTGILRNELYAGRRAWNKVQMIKDPDTGKRISRPNPPEEWHRAEAPELRIVSDDLFDMVQAQLAARSRTQRKGKIGAHKRPQYLLSGLLKCDACGSGMVRCGKDKSGKNRLRCSAHHGSRSCPAPKTYYAEDVEALVINSLTKELASPAQIHAYARAYMRERHTKTAQENQRRIWIESRLKAIDKENARLVDLMVRGVADTETLGAKSKELGRERDNLRTELASLPEGTNIVVHPAAVEHFARKLASSRIKLEYALHMLDDMGELQQLVREVISSITLSKDESGVMGIYVESYLEPFLKEPGKPQKAQGLLGVTPLVAEEGLEPPTRGL
ncbi:recombinase family protein [Pedomonas mirosovicensis]|uniref:recombinase family protein n=1 Tax=Pedomonas mirosovicensis TaxID=2908641 RepID=UPI0035BBD27F